MLHMQGRRRRGGRERVQPASNASAVGNRAVYGADMDGKLAERLDAWWASLDEAAQNELMDNPNALLSEGSAGLLGKDLLSITRWGEGEWEAGVGDDVRPYIDRRAKIRDARRLAE